MVFRGPSDGAHEGTAGHGVGMDELSAGRDNSVEIPSLMGQGTRGSHRRVSTQLVDPHWTAG
jgi:hypothetical protein